ncbi:hypothetical protein K2173_024807 [Erythroxylum novogranatense]|uniref:C2 domain-containing protein n=1 Tax=Erythroxylum novogranatense TaxID=1862640 RepID=A0AAV8UFU2_9ROSI|nr:hypothetical protein K2173_024807 [Erythroxylum novogranatense]
MGFIELKVVSCKQVTACNFFQKLSIYVSVSIINDGNSKTNDQRQRISTDTEGDGNPEWNQEMRFDLEEDGGKVRVPVKEMVEESRGGIVRFVNYHIDNNNSNKIYYPRVEVESSLLTMAENNYQTLYNSVSGIEFLN